MDATAVLALVAVISAAQVASLAISVRTCRNLATLATRSAAASTPQDFLMLERAAQVKKPGRKKTEPQFPIGL